MESTSQRQQILGGHITRAAPFNLLGDEIGVLQELFNPRPNCRIQNGGAYRKCRAPVAVGRVAVTPIEGGCLGATWIALHRKWRSAVAATHEPGSEERRLRVAIVTYGMDLVRRKPRED